MYLSTQEVLSAFFGLNRAKKPYMTTVKKVANKIMTLDNGVQIPISSQTEIKIGDKIAVIATGGNPIGIPTK